jgi:hypothetical protein
MITKTCSYCGKIWKCDGDIRSRCPRTDKGCECFLCLYRNFNLVEMFKNIELSDCHRHENKDELISAIVAGGI